MKYPFWIAPVIMYLFWVWYFDYTLIKQANEIDTKLDAGEISVYEAKMRFKYLFKEPVIMWLYVWVGLLHVRAKYLYVIRRLNRF